MIDIFSKMIGLSAMLERRAQAKKQTAHERYTKRLGRVCRACGAVYLYSWRAVAFPDGTMIPESDEVIAQLREAGE